MSGPPAKLRPKSGGSGRRATSARKNLVGLLDDDPIYTTAAGWRERNLELFAELVSRHLLDEDLVSTEAHRFLTETLISDNNPAAIDLQNAGHVRAQNENILHYALSLQVPKAVLTISLEAGFIHDLNKAVGEPLRKDAYAVHDENHQVVPEMKTLAQSVGLNHLGERTRAALARTPFLPKGALMPEVAEAIDRCIIHHGIGSSAFIQKLLDGQNEWWGEEFVDSKTGTRKLIHPAQPPLTLESVLHDLADSTQQMQGGVAWLVKYPEGFWREAGLSFREMLSGEIRPSAKGIPMSLKKQIEVETATCRSIAARGQAAGLLDTAQSEALDEAVAASSLGTRAWIDDGEQSLDDPRGLSVYHDLARDLHISPKDAVKKLRNVSSEDPESESLLKLLWSSARSLDLRRVRDLAKLLTVASNDVDDTMV